MEKTMDKIVQVAKARGFVYPGSEIYGGLANTWDYGNLGVELKKQCEACMVEEVHTGKPIQCWCGLRHPDEPTDLGCFRTSGRFF